MVILESGIAFLFLISPWLSRNDPVYARKLMMYQSELYGRQIQWIVAHVAMVAFFGGSTGSKNIETLLVLRLLGGIFGASPLVNSGGVIADMFVPAQLNEALP
jgi:MFS family permease